MSLEERICRNRRADPSVSLGVRFRGDLPGNRPILPELADGHQALRSVEWVDAFAWVFEEHKWARFRRPRGVAQTQPGAAAPPGTSFRSTHSP